jgi:hypothetical protein
LYNGSILVSTQKNLKAKQIDTVPQVVSSNKTFSTKKIVKAEQIGTVHQSVLSNKTLQFLQ